MIRYTSRWSLAIRRDHQPAKLPRNGSGFSSGLSYSADYNITAGSLF
jgi:hypothetical protein